MNYVVSLLRDEAGATSIEYAVVASGVAVVIVGSVDRLGSGVLAMWTTVSNALK
jgi:pilus assembly protein Flp/PilA